MNTTTRPCCRLRHRWDDSIKKDIRETGFKDADGIQLAQDIVQAVLVNMVIVQ